MGLLERLPSVSPSPSSSVMSSRFASSAAASACSRSSATVARLPTRMARLSAVEPSTQRTVGSAPPVLPSRLARISDGGESASSDAPVLR